MKRFISLCFIILAIFLNPPSVEGDLNFNLLGATSSSYKKFIQDLRNALPIQQKIYNVPVLYSTIPESKRFILINLFNYDGKSITVGIDVLNVYVVAYRTGGLSYFLDQAPAEASKLLFKDTVHKPLPYTGNYESLQTAAGKIREKIYLGFPALDSAITNLLHYDAKAAPEALIVVIESLAEAARYKYIEVQISSYVSTEFLPNLSIISLENKWSALSKQIQKAKDRNGQFENPVEIRDPEGNRVQITNVTSKVVTSNIQLLLNSRNIPPTEQDRDEAIVARPSNCGYEVEKKSIDNNGRENYVKVCL